MKFDRLRSFHGDSQDGAPRGIARFDSAAAMAQAVGAFLHRRDVSTLSGSPLLDRTMPLVNRLPRRLREWAYSLGGMTEAVPRAGVRSIDVDRIAEWIVHLFPARPYPAAFIGSSNGALTHLAAALDIPWLPQTFLCPVRNVFSDPDDAGKGLSRGWPVTRAIMERYPHVSVHHMHDPNQDRLMLKTMSYFRLKHRELPLSYRDFLVQFLPAGGTLYVVDCRQAWPVTRTSERSVFQFGALGGAEVDEYFHGSQRVRDYFVRYRVERTRWDPPQPDDTAPEAEWGFEPALNDHLYSLAAACKWRLVNIAFENPEALSWLAAAIYREWYRQLEHEPTRLLVDNFVLLDPYRTIRLRAVPFWLLFCVERSASLLEQFLAREHAFKEVDLMLFSHGTEGVGVASIERWRQLLACVREGRFLGVDQSRYPRDFATFINFHKALAELDLPYELPRPLSLPSFEALLQKYGPEFGVTSTVAGNESLAPPSS